MEEKYGEIHDNDKEDILKDNIKHEGVNTHGNHMKFMILAHVVPIGLIFILRAFDVPLSNNIQLGIFAIMPLSHVGMMMFMTKNNKSSDEQEHN